MYNDESFRKKYSYTGTLLISDMDGTLLNSSSQISRENYLALKEFTENGGKFTVATGRMEGSIKSYSPSIPINVPAILYNGSLIYDFAENKILWESSLGEEVEGIVIDLSKRFPEIGIEISHNSNYYFLKENIYTGMHRKIDTFSPQVLPIEAIDSIPKPWSQVILAWEPEKLIEVELYLKKMFFKDNNKLFRTVYSLPYLLELLNINASKGNALKNLIKVLDISCSDVIAIGDNKNDIEMIQVAGTGIAVANACTDLKKVADFCCCSNNEHVIPYVLKWLEMKREGSKR